MSAVALLCCMLALLAPNHCRSQLLAAPVGSADSTMIERRAQFGTNKIGNIYIFSADASASVKAFGGELTLQQRYRGIGLRSVGASFRDDEQLQLRYSLPLTDATSVVTRHFFVLSNDTRNIGLANLQRINSLVGISTHVSETFTIELMGGGEQFRQLGTSATAPTFAAGGKLSTTPIDDYALAGGFQGNYTRFSPERTNADLDANASITRELNDGNALQASARYRLLNRDFITPVGTSSTLATESRLEQRLSVSGGLVYALSGAWQAEVQANFDNGAVDRMYRRPLTDIPTTAVNRKLREFQISISSALQYAHNQGLQRIGIEYFTRNEENGTERRFPLALQDETTIRLSENQRDNSALRTRLFGQSAWYLSPKDSLLFNGSIAILQYDTPSEVNYDDRDELSVMTEARYQRRISEGLTAGFSLQLQMQHLVYLKAQRSALNNWNRILSFAPLLAISTHGLQMQPRFEVLANYTAYDFEGLSVDVQSFSFRQVSYRDSITLALGNNYRAQSFIFARYFERGQLSWSTFSETPLSKNYEQFIKTLIFLPAISGISVGCGGRYYALRQTSVFKTSPSGFSSDGIQQFYGPEIMAELQWNSGSKCTLSGWYERQYVNHVFNRDVPNLVLQALVTF
ncbi:MAG: hypothetical protein U0264_08135 [Candidatus Kapaibacterium sp.]